jgi:two-component sensor histidine kinase
MEQLLRILPKRPQSTFVRFGTTTILVCACFLLVLGMQAPGGTFGFFLMFPAVVFASLVFDRSAGVYAAVLSTALLYLVAKPTQAVLLPPMIFAQMGMFFLFAIALAVMSEGLHMAWARADTAERKKDLLLNELSHRTKNNLAIVVSMLSLQARMKKNPEVKMALEKSILRVQAVARAHDHFHSAKQDGQIEMQSYLETLCHHLADTLRDVKPIALKVSAEKMYLGTQEAISVGLITNELVLNSFKHAFPDDREGIVEVRFQAEPANKLLEVRDNGIGCRTQIQERIGSRLTKILAAELSGAVEWEEAQPGCRVRVRFPAKLSKAGNQGPNLRAA